MKITSVTAGFGLTVTQPGYGAVRVHREYTATLGRGENPIAVEAELEQMARESVLATLAAEPWKDEPPAGGPSPGPRRVITSFDPEGPP